MIHVTIEQGGGAVSWIIPTLAGLLGAVIGGVASLWGTSKANQHAVRMLRLQRREQAADDALGVLWEVMHTEAPPDMTAGDVVTVERVIGRTFDLANRCAGDEPHLQVLCHDYARAANAATSWGDFYFVSAALSGAITEWRTERAQFRKRELSFTGYTSELAESRQEVEANDGKW